MLAAAFAACTGAASRQGSTVDEAERLMETDVDSGMTMLDALEPYMFTADSVKAKFHYLRAWGHMMQRRSMIGDSLITFAHEYYRGRDGVRDTRSATARAWYKFWVGDTPGAIAMLDSLVNLDGVPDSVMRLTLRMRVLLGVSEYQGSELIPLVKRLQAIEADSMRRMEARYMLVSTYEYAGEMDSALTLIDGLIDYARANRWGDKQFYFELERAQILGELGRCRESDAAVDAVFAKSSADNGAADYLHMQYAMNALNMGDLPRASRELALADSFAVKLRHDDNTYYRSYSDLLRTMIDFKRSGKMKLVHVNAFNNRQLERYNRVKASQWESERGALQQQSRALALKAESEHKTVIILLVILVSVVLLAGAALVIRHRRQRELENEERAEALQQMVDELRASPAVSPAAEHGSQALRRAMLQQLGIIKMVAETPTEQNREMLRRISSIESDTCGELVNWDNVFELINNLYSDFYAKLHRRFGSVLTDREERIIVLMMAGFSTKEISVITGQTTATIYVRKSSIRKKLGVPEKEDIVKFLRETLTH